jgi:hypothetical protein
MTYSADAPPVRIAGGLGGPSLWYYSSTDVHTDVDASGYFTNGHALGLKVNDIMIVTKTDATVGATLHTVYAVTAGGAATIAAAILA